MDVVHNLGLGVITAFSLKNLAFCFVGSLLGTAIGVLPGLGPVATIAMLLPVTYSLEPVTALIMLAGIYYGAQYGGSTTAILVNLPGEASSVVTCLDGYQMARKGRAGAALAIAALGSFFAGTVATVVVAAFAPALSSVALQFGPAEYCALVVLGLISAIVLASGSILKALAVVIFGLLLGLVGTDPTSGTFRFTFGAIELVDGVEFVAVAMGFFAFAEIVSNLSRPPERAVVTAPITKLWPTREEAREAWPAVVRGTGIGSVLGVLPGGGALLASWASYVIEKRVAKDPSQFGKGAVQGLAGPESANNASSQTAFIPLLTLGIPSSGTMAMMAGAMTIHNIVPGPQIMATNPTLFWGLIVSMWIGNIMLVVLNLPLVGIWVKLLRIPYDVMFPAIIAICCIGLYGVNSKASDIGLAAGFGLVAFVLAKLRFELAPMILGFVLGPLLEENFRRAMLMSGGDPRVFITSPLALLVLAISAILLVAVALPAIRRKRDEVFVEE